MSAVVPTAFATADPLTDDALRAVPPHYPRPSRLAEPLKISPPKAAAAAERLGLLTVGDLLEHLPRDRGSASTLIDLAPGETATVVVEVRSISSRPVRRRGMRPLVEAVGGGRHRHRQGHVLQPAVARAQVPARHAAAAAGQVRGPQPLPRAVPRRDRRGRRRGGVRGRDLSGDRRAVLDADPRARARAAGRGTRRARAAARADARQRPAARPAGRARRRALRRPRGRAPAAGLRRAAAGADRAPAPPRAAPRGGARRRRSSRRAT